MSRRLGISVGARELHAVLAQHGRVVWAAAAAYQSHDEAASAIGQLAAEAPSRARRVRVVLGRDVVQLRTLEGTPPLDAAAARRYVAFEATRLFRKNGCPTITDARVLRVGARHRVLWAVAAPEPLVRAILKGCAEAGLALEALGVATDVLPWAVTPRPSTGELTVPLNGTAELLSVAPCGVWRSRLLRGAPADVPQWVPPLAATGERAPLLAGAYAVTRRMPLLDLLPPETRAARTRAAWKRLRVTTIVGAALWLAAGLAYVARLEATARGAERELARLRPAVDSVVAIRRELNAARSALAALHQAQRARSQTLRLLANLTRAMGDSTFLAAFQLAPDSTLRLTGYAPHAAQVLAQLEKVRGVRDARFEIPSVREQGGAGEVPWDRFSVLVRVGGER